MKNVYTVKQVNQYIGNMFAQDFMLNRICVKGEVSNCKYHTKGHIYFSLKDESGALACIMFAGERGKLPFRMEDGQQVVALGSISTYARGGTYQLYAKEIILDGAGLLAQRFQKLKEELEEMGMFAPEYKQQIPPFAKRVGIVTAPTGAAVRDIIHIAKRRNPFVQLILSPALVQGEGAKESIVRAIKRLEKQEIDVMIVGRGGGSMEDLWAFNEEEVARAVFDCPVPVISAVGHETDTTIVDYAADLRAPTPSAAAELAVYEYAGTKRHMDEIRSTVSGLLEKEIRMQRLRLEKYEAAVKRLHPGERLLGQKHRAAELSGRLRLLMEGRIQKERQRLAVRIAVFKGLSPVEKLNQGYAFVLDERHRAVKSAGQVKKGERLSLCVTDGIIHTIVERIEEKEQWS